jgi:predicted PurR-regulated permease PerM
MILTLIALFFLLRDGERAGERLLVLANGWLGDPGERLAEKIVEAVRGTFNGTIVVAFGEGLLIGAAYVITGVPNAVLFGFLTILFALVPFGAWIAFSAASLTLLATTGSLVIPAGLFAFGSSVMLIGDNLVQPAIIGGAARLPFFWALLRIIGGLESLGLVGLFIGPVIMAALLTVWREWGDVSPRRREIAGEGR